MADDLAGFLSGRTFLRHPQADPSRSAWGYVAESGTDARALAPARGGRQPLTFRADGTFHMTVIDPSDRTKIVKGTWHIDPTQPNHATLQFEGGQGIAAVRRTPDDHVIVDHSPGSQR
jgi:hypothetical protein